VAVGAEVEAEVADERAEVVVRCVEVVAAAVRGHQ
jgi:hypothetical protein